MKSLGAMWPAGPHVSVRLLTLCRGGGDRLLHICLTSDLNPLTRTVLTLDAVPGPAPVSSLTPRGTGDLLGQSHQPCCCQAILGFEVLWASGSRLGLVLPKVQAPKATWVVGTQPVSRGGEEEHAGWTSLAGLH